MADLKLTRCVAAAGLLVALMAPAAATSLWGQEGRGATRAELQAQLDAADAGGIRMSRSEYDAIQRRLREGDFRVGDQVALSVANEPTLQATFTVEPGPALPLPDLPPVPLYGVLRAELEERLTEHLSTYLRNPEVRATSLMRVAMFGAVGAPGFYHFSPHLTLSDAIMSAGGPAAAADFGRSQIKRGDQKLYNGKQIEQAITDGTTLDRLNLHGGDMIEVGQPRSLLASGMRALLTAGAIAASIIALRGL